MKKIFLTYIVCLLALFTVTAANYTIDSTGIVQPQSPPKLVNDFAGLMTADEVQRLEDSLVAFDNSTSNQICVVTIDTLNGIPIEEYALAIGRLWGIGQKGSDNGVLLLISKNDREVDIEVGYGLEPYLTDYASKSIIENSIVPNFKLQNYYMGIYSAVYSIKYFITEHPIPSAYGSLYVRPASFWEKYAGAIGVLIALLPTIIIFLIAWFFGGSSSTYSSSGWTSSSSSSYSSSSSSSYSGSYGSSSGGGSSNFGGYGGGSFGGGGASGKW